MRTVDDCSANSPPTASRQGHSDRSEADRLATLDDFAVVGTPPEKAFDDLSELAAHVCGTPIALISFFDDENQWFKSAHGLHGLTHIARVDGFCGQIPDATGVLEISDARLDDKFSASPWVVGRPHLRFYAAAPLTSHDGYVLGTFCVLDMVPRRLTEPQKHCLEVLAAQVMNQLEARRQAKRLVAEAAARHEADMALLEQQRILDAILEYTDVLIYAKDLDGRFVMTNPAVEEVTRARGGLMGRTDHELFAPDVADEYRSNDVSIIETGERMVFVEDLVHPDGSTHTYRSTKFPLINEAGEVLGIAGLSTDVTELVAARAAHQEAEQRWRALVEQSPIAVAVVDADGRAAYLNPPAVALFGGDPAAQDDDPTFDLVLTRSWPESRGLLAGVLAGGPPLRRCRGTIKPVGATGVTVEMNATRINYRGTAAVQLELRDVTDAVAAEAELERSASTDPLTGLLNRRGWDLRLPGLIADARDRRGSLVVALIDLDRFKAYNDRNGHHAGDVLLRGFADAVRAVLRGGDVLARWGGEEFIVAMADITPDHASRILRQVLGSVPSGQTCSIGYTVWEAPEPLADAVARADAALYQAKDRGRDQLAVLGR